MPKEELACKHLMVTKNQHKTILGIARREDKRITVILEEMLALYMSAHNGLIYYHPSDKAFVKLGDSKLWDYPDSVPE